jgi:hypothetical protein
MSPPINIDGTDITAATIDGQEVQEITIDGQRVFPAQPTQVLFADDFESYSTGSTPSDWSSATGAEVTTQESLSGSKSVRNLVNNNPGQPILKVDGLDNKPSTVSIAYYETSSSGGVAYVLRNQSGQRIVMAGTSNPTVVVETGNGASTLVDPTPNYERWRKIVINIDWISETVDVNWTDIEGSTPSQSISGPFVNSSNSIEEAALTRDFAAGLNLNPKGHEFVDDVWPET